MLLCFQKQGLKEMVKRLEYIDILRAFAIFLVTLGHVLEYGGYGDGLLYGVIYSFHMPLFFAISGFVAVYSLRNGNICLDFHGFIKFVWKKFRFIMVPYFVWNLIVHPFAFSDCGISMDGWLHICRSVFIANDSAWFLPCLFNLSVLLGVYRLTLTLLKQIRGGVLVDMLGLGLMFGVLVCTQHFGGNPFLRSVISYYIPFSIGVLLGHSEDLERRIIDNQCSFLAAGALFAIASGVFACGGDGLHCRVARLIAGVASVPVLFSVAKSLVLPTRISTMLVYIGQNTLVIYCLQNWLRIPNVSDWHLSVLLQFLVFGLFSVCAIVIMVAFASVLERSIVLRQILLGKN